MALPTDACYVLACHLDDKTAVEKLRKIRALDERQHLTLLCRDLNEVGLYARVSNVQYRLLKAVLPGPYTFLLEATREVPRRVSHPQKKTIGLRFPDHLVAQAVLAEMGQAVIVTTLQLPSQDEPMTSPHYIRESLQKVIDLVISTGQDYGTMPTTVIDWTGDNPILVRQGAGALAGPLSLFT